MDRGAFLFAWTHKEQALTAAQVQFLNGAVKVAFNFDPRGRFKFWGANR